MITKLRLKGFKSFDNIELDLRPFQVFVGINGAGKSNIFDALQLISRIANQDLLTAFGMGRGDIHEYFTRIGERYSDEMCLSVDLLLPTKVTDEWGQSASLKFNRLNYEVTIARHNEGSGRIRLIVKKESLGPIPRASDDWIKTEQLHSDSPWLPKLSGGRSVGFISTNEKGDILLHQDGHGGLQGRPSGLTRTILSSVSNAEFPHALATRQELSKIKLLQLDPAVMRMPSSFEASEDLLPSGQNMASMLARLDRERPRILKALSSQIASFVPDFSALEVRKDDIRRLYTIWAREGNEQFSAQVLSDGTLRLIALVALREDPRHSGVILFEEPENGVHPTRISHMAKLLKELATDFNDDPGDDGLSQVLINSHSPRFMAEVDDEDLLLVHGIKAVIPGHGSEQRSKVTKVKTDRMHLTSEDSENFWVRRQIEQMLDEEPLKEAKGRLVLDGV